MLEIIALMDELLYESCNQIAKLVYDPTLSNRFNEKDLKELYEKFRKFSLSFFEFDIDATKKLKLRSQEGGPSNSTHYA